MSGGINDGDVELGGFELPQSNVDGDTTLALSLKFVQNPGVLERALTHLQREENGYFDLTFKLIKNSYLLGFLLELLDSTLVDTTAFVDQMTSGGRFTGVYVTDDDDVDVSLFLAHC